MKELEQIPADEEANIKEIARLTIAQLERRYGGNSQILRGVHAKGHGCVRAVFKVNDNLPERLRYGVFADPGRSYDAVIRFSNAAVAVTDDTPLDPHDPTKKLRVHGSRGMAVKLMNVTGTPLLTTDEPLTQDFLMINQPVFAFANIEDYLALSQVLEKTDDPIAFFARTKDVDEHGAPTEKAKRALKTLGIVQRIQSLTFEATQPATTGAFQDPPASPLDNQYFGAAPFLFGPDHVMKVSARPVAPVVGEKLDVTDPDYLGKALRKRLSAPDARDVVFTFQVQVRTADEIAGHIATDIEDATVAWEKCPFEDVATITISPQELLDVSGCENLSFSPWHGLTDHRPLGGINRLRRPVYEASSHKRLGAKATGGCPMSGIS
jgi:hypothetical protein